MMGAMPVAGKANIFLRNLPSSHSVWDSIGMSNTRFSQDMWQSPEALHPTPNQRITVVLKELPGRMFNAIFLPNHGRSHRVLFDKPIPRRATYGPNYRFWWQVKHWRATSIASSHRPQKAA